MKQITQESVDAFLNKRKFRKSNMSVDEDYSGRMTLYLHGNAIARYNSDGDMEISNAGWSSNTTKERLNGLPYVNIYQKNYVWYLNKKEWDGGWVNPKQYGIKVDRYKYLKETSE